MARNFRFCDLSETGSLYIALAILDLTMETRLILNLEKATCLCLLSAKIKVWATTDWLAFTFNIAMEGRVSHHMVQGDLAFLILPGLKLTQRPRKAFNL